MAKLISYAYLRKETQISQNIEDKYLDNPIKLAERVLKFLLGTAFYDELVSQNDSSSLTAANQSLYDPYVKEYLAWQAYQYWLAKANLFESRTGIRKFKEDNSDYASDKDMGELLRIAKQQTEMTKGEMLSFLQAAQREDTAAYPLYRQSCMANSGGGFHVTSISNKDTTYLKIDREKFYNGE